MATNSNPQDSDYEAYLQSQLTQLSEKAMLQSGAFMESIKALMFLLQQEAEGNPLRKVILPYLEQLGKLTLDEKRQQDIKWLTLTSMVHLKWDDGLVIKSLTEIMKRSQVAFAVSYQLHCTCKDKLDELAASSLKNYWLLLLVEAMNRLEVLAECSSVQGLCREVTLKQLNSDASVWSPE